MSEIATAEQMYAVGAAIARHGITSQPEACELWTAATGGELRALTSAEAVELVDRLDAMPKLIATVRPPACEEWWPFARPTRRTRRTNGTS